MPLWTELVAQIAFPLFVMAAGLFAVRLARQRILAAARTNERMGEARRKQLQTTIQVAGWTANVLIVSLALLTLLGYFVDITPLLAGLGVAGLALSLGAQTLIKDLIGGFMILIENQYAVGDVIKVGDVSGSVERLTLRATYVRDINGSLHLVPNGDVRVVSNVTRGWSRAMVDIGVAYEENMDRVLKVLEGVAGQFAADPEYAPHLLEPPTVLGPLTLGDWAITVRVMVKTLPGKQWGVAMQLRKRILAACEQEQIVLPYPRQRVFLNVQPEDRA
jgi:small-conductance mechanosensitive channel